MTKPKSPNVLSIEKIVQPKHIITLDKTDQEYLLESLLGFGFFGMTFRGRGLNNNQIYALKFQPLERAKQEAETHQAIALYHKCSQIVEFVYFGILTQVSDPFGKVNTEPTFDYLKLYFPNNQITPEIEHALTLLRGNQPDAWETLTKSGATLKEGKGQLGCVVMEYAQGTPLSSYSGAITIEKALDIVTEISNGILHMHSWGFIHGDLKPENIIINKDYFVKILDFSTTTREGEKSPAIATSFYSPLNQHNKGIVNRYSDVYAIASIFYKLITGHDPVTQYIYTYNKPQAYNPASIASAHPNFIEIRARVVKYWEHMPNIPLPLREVLCRVIAPEVRSINSNNLTTSETGLQSAILMQSNNLPVSLINNVMIPNVLSFVPEIVTTNTEECEPIIDVQEVILELRKAYDLHKKRQEDQKKYEEIEKRKREEARRERHKKEERQIRQKKITTSLWVLLGVFMCGLIVYFSNKANAQREAIEFQITATAEAGLKMEEQASIFFNKGFNLSQSASNTDDIKESEKKYREALINYNEALIIFEDLASTESFTDRERGVAFQNASIASWNMYVVYDLIGETNMSNELLKRSIKNLEFGHAVYPFEEDEFELIKRYLLWGLVLQEKNEPEEAVNVYSKCVEQLDNLDSETKQDVTNYLIDELIKIQANGVSSELNIKINNLLMILQSQ